METGGHSGEGRITVVMCADDAYAAAGAVAIRSLCDHLSVGADIWLLYTRLGAGSLALLRRAPRGGDFRLLTVNLSRRHYDFAVRSDYISSATFGRLQVGGILPATCERALYLDCDVLVRGDLDELWRTDLGGKVVGAALEQTAPTLGSNGVSESVEALELNAEYPYFNAGVLLIDLKAWREANVGVRASRYLRRLQPRLMDQDSLNAVLAGSWKELNPVWNLTSYWFRTRYRQRKNRALLACARVVHYVGHRKPWTRDVLWTRGTWWKYRRALDRPSATRSARHL